MPSQLHPQGQSHLFPTQSHSYPQPAQNAALSHGMQHAKSPKPVGRPSMPNQGVQSQLYSQYAGGLVRPIYPGANQQVTNQSNMLKINNQMQLSSEQHFAANSKPAMTGREANHISEKGSTQKEAEVFSHKSVNSGANGLNSVTDIAASAGEIKAKKSETDMKSMDANQANTDHMTYLSENGEPKLKPIMKEDSLESTLGHSSKGKPAEVVPEDAKDVLKAGPEQVKHSTVEGKKTLDDSPQKMRSLHVVENYEGHDGRLLKDPISKPDEGSQGVSMTSAQILSSPSQNVTSRGTAPGSEAKSSYAHGVQEKSRPQVAGVDENRGSLQPSQVQAGGFLEPSRSIFDQGRHQLLPSYFGPSSVPKRPGAPPLVQLPFPGHPHQTQGLGPHQTYFGPQRPGHVPEHVQPSGSIPDPSFATSFGRGPSPYGTAQQSSELQSLSHVGAFRTSQGEHVGAPSSGLLPPRPFDLHGGTMARTAPHGPEIYPNQRPNNMDDRGPSGMHPNMTRMNGSMGFDSLSAIGSRDERLAVQDERFNPFPPGPDHRVSDRAEFENDLKQFPRPFLDAETMPRFGHLSSRPFDRGPHGLKFDTGLKSDAGPGSVPSRFLSPYNGGGANDAGEGPGGRHEDTFGRIEPSRGHHDFFGPGPAYGRHHMDSFAVRSPGRERLGISLHGFRGPGPDDIQGREGRRFGEPFGSSFHESRFPMLPSHLRRDEFEGPGNIRMGDHLRHDLIGRDGFSSHLHRGEHMDNLYHLPFGEPDGFGAHPRHARIREMGGPGSFDLFGVVDRPSHPHFGEPGFRSSFSLRGFPKDGDIYTVKCFFL